MFSKSLKGGGPLGIAYIANIAEFFNRACGVDIKKEWMEAFHAGMVEMLTAMEGLDINSMTREVHEEMVGELRAGGKSLSGRTVADELGKMEKALAKPIESLLACIKVS